MLPPKNYFSVIKTRSDWKSADVSDMGYRLFGEAFPNTWKAHKRVYKQYLKGGVNDTCL